MRDEGCWSVMSHRVKTLIKISAHAHDTLAFSRPLNQALTWKMRFDTPSWSIVRILDLNILWIYSEMLVYQVHLSYRCNRCLQIMAAAHLSLSSSVSPLALSFPSIDSDHQWNATDHIWWQPNDYYMYIFTRGPLYLTVPFSRDNYRTTADQIWQSSVTWLP